MCPDSDRLVEPENLGVLVPPEWQSWLAHRLSIGDFSSCCCPHLMDEPTKAGRDLIVTRKEANNYILIQIHIRDLHKNRGSGCV